MNRSARGGLGAKSVKHARFERVNGLDTALYKNLLFLFYSLWGQDKYGQTRANNLHALSKILCNLSSYSRTPILRPPSESHWCGRKRGVVVHDWLDYFTTCALRNTAMHNRIIHTEKGFRGVPVAIADRGKRSGQSATMSLAAFPTTMCLFTELIYPI